MNRVERVVYAYINGIVQLDFRVLFESEVYRLV